MKNEFKDFCLEESVWGGIRRFANKLIGKGEPDQGTTPYGPSQLTPQQKVWVRFNDYFPMDGGNKKAIPDLSDEELRQLAVDAMMLTNHAASMTDKMRFSKIRHSIRLEQGNRNRRASVPARSVEPETITPPETPRKKWRRKEQLARADLIVQQMHKDGKPNREIATAIQDATGVSRRTALKWLKNMRIQWRIHDDEGVRDVDMDRAKDFRSYIAGQETDHAEI